MAELVEKLNPSIKIATFDAIPENIELLKEGKFSLLIEQNSFAQAWNSLIHLYNACNSNWKPTTPKLFMPPIPITIDNYRSYWDDAKNKRILQDEEKGQLAEVLDRRPKRAYKFALIMPLSTGFFEGLGRGAEAARQHLKELGIEVTIVDAFNTWNDFGSVSIFAPIIDSFIAQNYDGIATVVVDPNLTPAINKAISKGLTVTSFNTEPSNFREILLTIINNGEVLARDSQNLAASAEESSRTTAQIVNSIKGIHGDIENEKDKIAGTDKELSTLNEQIANMQSSLAQYAQFLVDMTDQSLQGSNYMAATWQETEKLKTVIDTISQSLNAFQEKLLKVNEFAAIIENLSESTNVLAINASIQAARAGTAGKSFAVVAGEIRSLAGNSGKTAEDIRLLINEVSRSMSDILINSSQGIVQMDANLDKTQRAKESFESIVHAIEEANKEISTIENSVMDIVEAGNGVKQNILAIEDMSNSSIRRLEEISSSVNEYVEQAELLSLTANNLSSLTTNQELVFSQLSVKE